MNRTTGHLFIAIAALLYISRYMAAALIVSGDTSVSRGQFRSALDYIGPHPLWLAIACAAIGWLILRPKKSDSKSEDVES